MWKEKDKESANIKADGFNYSSNGITVRRKTTLGIDHLGKKSIYAVTKSQHQFDGIYYYHAKCRVRYNKQK